MPAERLVLLVTFGLTGVLLMGLARPLVRRRVKPNGLYGVRLPDTLADERVWYDVNEVGGRDLFRLGVLNLVGGALAALAAEPWLGATVGVLAGAIVAYAVWMAVRSFRLARRLRAEYAAQDRGHRPA